LGSSPTIYTYDALSRLTAAGYYQGRLANSGGMPINGTQTMQFAIYNGASGGRRLWVETAR
jgi:hypothetical protein